MKTLSLVLCDSCFGFHIFFDMGFLSLLSQSLSSHLHQIVFVCQQYCPGIMLKTVHDTGSSVVPLSSSHVKRTPFFGIITRYPSFQSVDAHFSHTIR